MLSHELQLVIELCRYTRRNRRPTVVQLGRLAELRTEYDEIAKRHPLPSEVTCQEIDAGDVSAASLSGPGPVDNGAILYLHGGCYATGSVETHRELMSRLSIAASMRVLGLNYRLAPLHPFPAAIEDAAAAYRRLCANGVEPTCIAIAGDSAGAGLAVAATLTIRDEDLPLPGAIVSLSPWLDLP